MQGFVQPFTIHPHLRIIFREWFGVERGKIGIHVFVVPISILTEVIGDGKEPCGHIAALLIAVACLIHPQEDIVGIVCRCFLVAAQLSEKEAL